MKKLMILAALSLCLVSCNLKPADPVRAGMEAYAKQHMDPFSPRTFEFDCMSMPDEHRYFSELEEYRAGLEKRYENDPEFCDNEYRKIDELEKKYGVSVACTEYTMHFWAKNENGVRLPMMVFAVFDPDGNVLWMGMKKEDIPTFPAMNILRERGEI